jgi:WD repeat-containing protein 68
VLSFPPPHDVDTSRSALRVAVYVPFTTLTSVPSHHLKRAYWQIDPLYGIAFSHSPIHPNRIALSSYSTTSSNKLSIVDNDPSVSQSGEYQHLASTNIHVPFTKVAWEPRESLPHEGTGGRGELLATSGDVLRLWEVTEGTGGYSGGNGSGSGYVGRGWSNDQSQGGGYSISSRGVLTNVRDGMPAIAVW